MPPGKKKSLSDSAHPCLHFPTHTKKARNNDSAVKMYTTERTVVEIQAGEASSMCASC